jgi:hypothetical protein
MNTQIYTNKIMSLMSTRSIHVKSLPSQQVPLFPLPLYRTRKHKCERCGERCHIMYEIGKTDCTCEQYIIQKK